MLEIRSQRSETEIMAAHVKVQVMNEFASPKNTCRIPSLVFESYMNSC